MANNRINRYIGAIALGTILTAVPSCTDTWDDHYKSDSNVAGTSQTLWDVIKNNPDYERFANIVSKAKYYKDNTHPVSDYTYEDILNGGQVNTVWVPDNSVLTETEYQKWMNMLQSDNITDGYNVQQQFLGNHIALWRHNISEATVDTVKMINGKNLTFDKGKHTLEGVPLGEYNIPTANGVMHVLKGVAPFRYNFYEHLKFRETPTQFGKYVVAQDTTYFFRDGSIEGLPDEYGKPTYVDSVYYTSNRLFESTYYLPEEGRETWQMAKLGFGARINNEDSVFVMVMPTDNAWNNAYEELKKSHVYATIYDNKEKGDMGTTTTIRNFPADSLQKMSIEMDMIAPLVFNIHKQPKRGGKDMWTLDMFKEYKGDNSNNPDPSKNYLLNTFGDTLRAVGDWKPSDLFEGEPLEMSNGIVYEVSSWNFPSQYYTPDVEVEVENTGMFYNMTNTSKHKLGTDAKRYSFSNEKYKDITDIYGKVSNNNFFHLARSGATAGPKVYIKLFGNSPSAYVPNAQVMKGKYDIQVVVVPYWYLDIAKASAIDDVFYVTKEIVNPDDETDIQYEVTDEINTEYIETRASMNKYKLKATIEYNNNRATDAKKASSNIEYDGLKVDTLTVLQDFEFPYSYKNMRFSYPTLYLEGVTSKTDAKNGFIYDLIIDKIILKRKN